MAASPYLLRILSKPTQAAVDSWLDWYKIEGFPETLSKVKATRGGLYHAYNTFELATKTPIDTKKTKLHEVEVAHIGLEPPADKTCLVMCQLSSIENVEEIFKLAHPPQDGLHGAVSDVRVYRLIEDFDPHQLGHRRPPFILNVQVHPADADDYNSFYSGEHLHMLSKVPGYRRSQRYELVAGNTEESSQAPRFMAVHEWDHLNSLDGPELREADISPNTRRVFGNASKVNIRGFENIQTFGDIKV